MVTYVQWLCMKQFFSLFFFSLETYSAEVQDKVACSLRCVLDQQKILSDIIITKEICKST